MPSMQSPLTRAGTFTGIPKSGDKNVFQTTLYSIVYSVLMSIYEEYRSILPLFRFLQQLCDLWRVRIKRERRFKLAHSILIALGIEMFLAFLHVEEILVLLRLVLCLGVVGAVL